MESILCPTYIGRIGGMKPTPCVKEISPSHEQRVVFGGGEGTLAPKRARVYGPGARAWSMDRETWLPHENSALFSLARRQSLYGGSYRVIPCDAVRHNLFTPRASEELYDWTGLSVGPAESFWVDLKMEDDSVEPVMLGRVGLGQTAVSPHVPAVMIRRMWAYLYVSGVGELSYRIWSNAGTSTEVVVPFEVPSTHLARDGGTFLPPASTVSVQIAVKSTIEAPVYFAWPSIAYADNPYVTGRGCDSAYISMPGRGALTDTIESFSYQIVEVGV